MMMIAIRSRSMWNVSSEPPLTLIVRDTHAHQARRLGLAGNDTTGRACDVHDCTCLISFMSVALSVFALGWVGMWCLCLVVSMFDKRLIMPRWNVRTTDERMDEERCMLRHGSWGT